MSPSFGSHPFTSPGVSNVPQDSWPAEPRSPTTPESLGFLNAVRRNRLESGSATAYRVLILSLVQEPIFILMSSESSRGGLLLLSAVTVFLPAWLSSDCRRMPMHVLEKMFGLTNEIKSTDRPLASLSALFSLAERVTA